MGRSPFIPEGLDTVLTAVLLRHKTPFKLQWKYLAVAFGQLQKGNNNANMPEPSRGIPRHILTVLKVFQAGFFSISFLMGHIFPSGEQTVCSALLGDAGGVDITL